MQGGCRTARLPALRLTCFQLVQLNQYSPWHEHLQRQHQLMALPAQRHLQRRSLLLRLLPCEGRLQRLQQLQPPGLQQHVGVNDNH